MFIGTGISPFALRRGSSLIPPEQIGTIIGDDFSSSNWASFGSPLATFNASDITFASKAVNLDNYIYYKTYNNTDNVKFEATFEVLSNNPFFHFGFVGRGQVGGGSDVGWVVQLTNTGSLIFFQQAGKAGGALSYSSAGTSVTGLSILAGDIITVSMEFIGGFIYLTFTDNGTPYTNSYNTQYYNFGGNSINSLVTPMFMNINANVKMTSWELSSTSFKNYTRLAVGDSITRGYNAGSLANRWPVICGMEICAGGGNTTQDVINNMNEILLMNPQNKVFLLIGLNDDTSGIADAVWQANYVTIVNTLESAGKTVVKLLYAGWGAFGIAVNTFITTTYPSSYIDTSTPLETSAGVINATYNAGDGHPNAAGNALIASIIQASPLY